MILLSVFVLWQGYMGVFCPLVKLRRVVSEVAPKARAPMALARHALSSFISRYAAGTMEPFRGSNISIRLCRGVAPT